MTRFKKESTPIRPRCNSKWGDLCFFAFTVVMVIIFPILYGIFNIAQGSKNSHPQNLVYEGEIDLVAIYTFETSTNETCVLARRKYNHPAAISCRKKD